jgi:VWFA-related protein
MQAAQKRLRVPSLSRQALSGAAGALVALGTSHAVGAQEAQQPRVAERVDVSRVVVDVRVFDNRRRPITDLTVSDFRVTIDGKPAAVESVQWVGGAVSRHGETPLAARPIEADSPAAPGRLIVFLFQKSMEGSRIWGFMRTLTQARGFLDTLTDEDRVAILSFDSHLKVWVDFTNDLEPLRRALARGILFERPPAVREATGPSLVKRLAPSEGRRTYHIEEALKLIAEALEPLPGAKSLVLFGHGFGRLTRGFTIKTSIAEMEHGYEEAAKALRASRTSVFSLDVTKADFHSLEIGLQQVSDETGGFYVRTHIFPELAMKHLASALAGYYVLLVEKPDAERRTHRIEVELTRRKGDVLAKSGFD